MFEPFVLVLFLIFGLPLIFIGLAFAYFIDLYDELIKNEN